MTISQVAEQYINYKMIIKSYQHLNEVVWSGCYGLWKLWSEGLEGDFMTDAVINYIVDDVFMEVTIYI